MPPRQKLNEFDRTRAIAWLQYGVGVREVPRILQLSHLTIIRLRQWFAVTGRLLERRRKGRPKKTTVREDLYIQHQATQKRTSSSSVFRRRLRAATYTTVSSQTIRNCIHDVNLRARRPVRKPTLTQNQRANRQIWCTAHQRLTNAQWTEVLFTDESRFC
ncbi:uncharacterized protein LOC118477763 [Aplysia californica]|uniref:Uncharacterized protein LOC118477763 n=1 Tax=Aplysia californica TaxID=6500 RepID=A0ABM1VU09_APLCA|nr:uncharacterized protein LOC118477763 [Aplysia californica]